MIWQYVVAMHLMVTYGNDSIQINETETDFSELGPVNISRMNGSIPFYSFNEKNKGNVMREDVSGRLCEYNNSCTDYL